MDRSVLDGVLAGYGRLAVLFSGGRDSEVLLRTAVEVLGRESVLSLTADSPLLAGFYRDHIIGVCRELDIEPVRIMVWDHMDPLIMANDSRRCYHCKKAIYTVLSFEARLRGFEAVADGTTRDDLGEDRPGLRAALEQGILHPFVEACIGNSAIAELAGELVAAGTFPPPDSCLATRLPAGTGITRELLGIVEKLEQPVRPLAKGRFRIRMTTAGIRVEYEEIDSGAVISRLPEIEELAAGLGLEVETVRTG